MLVPSSTITVLVSGALIFIGGFGCASWKPYGESSSANADDCKKQSELVEFYFDSGEISAHGRFSNCPNERAIGTSENHVEPWQEQFRVGQWSYSYESGKPRAQATYDLGTMTQCCTGGPCEIVYEYLVDDLVVWNEDGETILSTSLQTKPLVVESSCEGNFVVRWQSVDPQVVQSVNEVKKSGILEDVLPLCRQFWNHETIRLCS